VITTWNLKCWGRSETETHAQITLDDESDRMTMIGDPEALATMQGFDLNTEILVGWTSADTAEEIYGALLALKAIGNRTGAILSVECDRDIHPLELKYDESRLPIGAKI
jgi:hypothetical protein